MCKILFERKETFHFTIEKLQQIAQRGSKKKISLATLYNTVRAFKKMGYLKEIALQGNKTFFDTNTENHHHFYDEDSSQLIDIKKENVLIHNLPSAPSGKKIKDVEIDTIEKIIDPSGTLDSEEKLQDIYKPKQGLGFFGYIFLLIIIGFSMVGILKTFENDLLNNFPETEYIYQLLDEQLEFLAESVKNVIVIINDLIDSY